MSSLHNDILEELRALREQRPEWLDGVVYDDPDDALDPLDRREHDRLARLYRGERQQWRERTRERVARERNRPWQAEESWGIRKRLWRERRDHERELLDVRESVILQREDDLRRWLPLYQRRLRELALLEPETSSWCETMARNEIDPPGVDDLSAVWKGYRAACTHRADTLLVDTNLRQQFNDLRSVSDERAAEMAILLVDAALPPIAGLLAALIVRSRE